MSFEAVANLSRQRRSSSDVGTLTFAPRPHSDEALGSWLRRLAEANSQTLATFLDAYSDDDSEGLSRDINRDSYKESMVARIAADCGLSSGDLPTWDYGKRFLHGVQRYGAFCAECWAQDIADGPADQVYRRHAWDAPFAYACDRHRMPLWDGSSMSGSQAVRPTLHKVRDAIRWAEKSPNYKKRVAGFLALQAQMNALAKQRPELSRGQGMFRDVVTSLFRHYARYNETYCAAGEAWMHWESEPEWRNHWHLFFCPIGAAESFYGNSQRRSDGRVFLLPRACDRRFRVYVVLRLLGDWGQEPHPMRPWFRNEAWAWLRRRALGWPEQELAAIRPLTEIVRRL